MEAINSGRVGVCKWSESGTTIDTAIPEIRSLTDDKKEWRAIIVRYLDDNCMADFQSDVRNPYDFTVNKNANNTVGESPIPLVRLTQMLGGVPPLEVQFKPEIVREPHKAPRTVYTPIEDTRKERAHRELTAKYAFDGKRPSSILVISVRDKSYQAQSVGRSWLVHKESDSSEFWKRNHFPSICRFMVYDIEKQGPIQKEADDFGFWYSVMLMAINEWDSSTIQAYRLYTLGVSMNPEAMSESFQMLADRLRDAKHSIERSIKREIEGQVCAEMRLPEYRLEIPVSLKLPKGDICMVKQSSFRLLSEGAATDTAIWQKAQRTAEKKLADSIRLADRSLDQTADKMRTKCTFSVDEVLPLSKYQMEDMKRETDEIYQQIVHIQGNLPKEDVSADAELRNAAHSVKRSLVGRVLKRPAILAVGLATLLVLASATPAFATLLIEKSGSMTTLLHVLGGGIAAIAVVALLVLFFQKAQLNLLVTRYNNCLKNVYNKLVKNAGNYSLYMSAIASYSRGRSYLELSNRKKHASNSTHYSKYKHIKAIDALLRKLKMWSKAYHLEVDFTTKRSEIWLDIDTTIDPSENKLYSLATGDTYTVAINHSGMSMYSLYPFARQIAIIREELYEDE